MLKTNAIAVEVLKRCTGEQSLDAIVDDLASTFTAERSRVDTDVRTLLTELATKRLVDL